MPPYRIVIANPNDLPNDTIHQLDWSCDAASVAYATDMAEAEWCSTFGYAVPADAEIMVGALDSN